MEFIPSASDDASLERYVSLMHACFPGAAGKFSLAYLRWLYAANPDGPVIGFDAFEGGRLAAHYACVPAAALLQGRACRVMLSLNTATHPDFQGRGLFTQLAQRTYDAAESAGLAAVYGIANANSTPGFTRKLGFQLVSPLDARVGMGRARHRGATAQGVDFVRTRSPAAWAWRLSNPHNAVLTRSRGDAVQCFARAAGPLLWAYDEVGEPQSQPATAPSLAAAAPRLFLGLEPGGLPASYLPIPMRLRPSPLNLIYRPLAGAVPRIDAARVRLGFLDFDAY